MKPEDINGIAEDIILSVEDAGIIALLISKADELGPDDETMMSVEATKSADELCSEEAKMTEDGWIDDEVKVLPAKDDISENEVENGERLNTSDSAEESVVNFELVTLADELA